MLTVSPEPAPPDDPCLHSLQGQPGERGEDGLPGKPGLRVWTPPPPHQWVLLNGVFGVVSEPQLV